MKLDQLRKIIREEVRSAVKSELQDIMNEAVKAASTPTINKITESKPVKVKNDAPTQGKSSISDMLNATKNSMTNEDYRTVFNGTSDMVTGMPNMATSMATQMNRGAGAQPGIDISNLDFVKKAGQILKASNEKDKSKAQIV